MPRTRKGSSNSRRVNYREYSSEEGEEEEDIGMFTALVGLFLSHATSSRKRNSSGGRPSKRRPKTANCGGHCCHCHNSAPKKRCTSQKNLGKTKSSKSATSSTLAKPNECIDLESDEEVVDPTVTETHTGNIKNKVDNFFKALESDDEEFDEKLDKKKGTTVPPENKNKEFYSLSSSDSDTEMTSKKDNDISITGASTSTFNNSASQPSTSTFSGLSSQPSTSAFNHLAGPGLKALDVIKNLTNEKKSEDLFAYVDNILSECNDVVDITEDRPKENVPELSLEDLKKKTDEILGGVSSLIEGFEPKPKEPEKTVLESPVKEAPICPVCLEQLGGSRQAMATLCGHMFCEPCILQVIKSTKKCPSCRKGLTKTKYHPVYI